MKRNINKIVLAVLMMMACGIAHAQDDIVCDQYHYNYYMVNPAVGGAERCSHLMLT